MPSFSVVWLTALIAACAVSGHGWVDRIAADGVSILAPSVFWADPKRNPQTAVRVAYGSESVISSQILTRADRNDYSSSKGPYAVFPSQFADKNVEPFILGAIPMRIDPCTGHFVRGRQQQARTTLAQSRCWISGRAVLGRGNWRARWYQRRTQ